MEKNTRTRTDYAYKGSHGYGFVICDLGDFEVLGGPFSTG
jgi:hypothetical protein